jgi:tetratricopeptide (TPR) repeat protein
VLEGSVRKAGNKLRITAQLVNAADGYHLWSETYDRELDDVFAIQDEISRDRELDDVFAIQDEISRAIASTLELELAVAEDEPLAPVRTRDMEAYDLYLKGRHFWFKRYKVGLQTAVEFFQKAAAKDPAFALPYTGIADAFTGLGAYGFIPPDQARAVGLPAAERALALDDTLAESHIAMARALLLKWDWDGAEAAIERGVELDPEHAEGLGQWGVFVAARGRLEEALERVERARAIDPDSLRVAIQAASVKLAAKRYDEAREEFEWVLEREPLAVDALALLGSAYGAMSLHDEAITAQEKAVALSNRAPAILAQLGVAYGRAGMEREAQAVVDELQQRSEGEYVAPCSLAVVAAARGRTAEVLEHLQATLDEVSPAVFSMAFLPVWDVMRSDARSAALLEKTGL